MREPQPYALSDKTASRLNRKAIRRFEQCEAALIRDFDELNVMRQVTALYKALRRDNKTAFLALFAARYLEILLWRGKDADDDTVDELAETYITGILQEPDAVTRYSYDMEVPRKRERLVEAINAVNGKSDKRAELSKALRLWTQMTGQYADEISEAANVRALKDAGVRYVRWVTLEDARVCKTCTERDGSIYPIDRVPPKPHYRCRCTVRPLDAGE